MFEIGHYSLVIDWIDLKTISVRLSPLDYKPLYSPLSIILSSWKERYETKLMSNHWDETFNIISAQKYNRSLKISLIRYVPRKIGSTRGSSFNRFESHTELDINYNNISSFDLYLYTGRKI